MIKYLLIALTISVVFTNGFEYEQLKSERSDDVRESAAHLINRLVTILRDAFDKGKESYEKVINDEDVKAILSHLGPISRKVADSLIQGFKDVLDKIDNATKEKTVDAKRDLRESSAHLINRLVNLLKDAFAQGKEAYEKVINDEDVKAILGRLGPLSRKVANSIIQGFKDILDKIDNATKDSAVQSKRDLRESSAHLINRLVNILRDAFTRGKEAYEKVINDEDVKAILSRLGPLSRKIADSIIQGFKDILDKIDNATKNNAVQSKRDLRESSAHLINRLVNILRDAFTQGQEAYEKVINDEDVKAILSRLGPLSRKIADSIIQGFKDILDKIDNATKDKSTVLKRDLKETSASLLKKLVKILKKAFEEGREAYQKVINDEDVKEILDRKIELKVANSLIQGFQNILERIDNATNDQHEQNKRDLRETSAQLINRLVRLLKKAFEEGQEAYEKVINDEDVKAILEHLGPLRRKVAESIIRGFKDILDRIDNATKDKSKLSRRGIKESSAHLINRLVNLLRQGFEDGRAAFEKVVNDEDVKGILEHLGTMSRKVAQSIIRGFSDLLDQIDQATKPSNRR